MPFPVCFEGVAMLRRGVDVHRVQRLMRHSDVRVTTSIYGHLVVEDLRSAVDAHTPLPVLQPRPETQALRMAPNAPEQTLAAFLLHAGPDEGTRSSDLLSQPLEETAKARDGRSRV